MASGRATSLAARSGAADRGRGAAAAPGRGRAAARGCAATPRAPGGPTACSAPSVALVVAESQKELVRSLEHLPGTRVGITSPGAPEQAWLAWLLARAGLSPGQVLLVSRGERGLSHAVETGDVHAALLREPAASRLLAAGQARLLVDLRTPAAVRQALGAITRN